jgi:fluoroacetyl-CoA thioesterase
MQATLTQGTSHSMSKVVDESMTVPQVRGDYASFAEMPRVFATAALVGFIEAACMETLAPYLDEGEVTLGTLIDITHSAPTTVGGTVRAEVTVSHVEPRSVSFSVTVVDDEDVVSVGTHTRAVISRERFDQKVADKAQRLGL